MSEPLTADRSIAPHRLGLRWHNVVDVPTARPGNERDVRLALRSRTPILLRGVARRGEARDFDVAWFAERFRDVVTPVLPLESGRMAYSFDRGFERGHASVRELDDEFRSARVPTRMVLEPPGEKFPDLARVASAVGSGGLGAWHDARVSFAGAGSCAPIHVELAQNLFAVLDGDKEFLLIRPRQSWRLYLKPGSAAPHISPIDPLSDDRSRYSLANGCTPWRARVRSGDALYFPTGWWHAVYTHTTTLALATWWAVAPWSLVQRAAGLYKRMRGFDPG